MVLFIGGARIMESLYIFATTLGVLGVAGLLQLLYWWKKASLSVLPPGPPLFVPILGHLPNLLAAGKSLHRYLARLARKHGPILFLRLGSAPVIVISSPHLAKQILHTHDKTFANRPNFTSSKFLGGVDGHRSVTLLPHGEEWKAGRKLYSLELLSAQRIREYQSGTISHEIHHLISDKLLLLQPLLQPLRERGPALVNLTDCFDRLLENIICGIALRQRPARVTVDRSSSGSASLSRLMRELTDLLVSPMITDFVPWLGFLDYKLQATMNKWRSSFTAVVDHIIAEHKRIKINPEDDDDDDDVATSSTDCKSTGDIVDVFLSPENNLSRDMIQVRIAELLAAGIETSSATLDWAMAELLANPRVLAKLRAELDQVVGLERCIDHSDMPHLPYLQAVVKETFRMHPAVPMLVPHMPSETCHVGGYTIPKGARIFVNAWAIGHDPEVWKDPEVFMPERFLVAGANPVGLKGNSFELLPFGSGRRICPGMGLAVTIVELTLSTLIHSLEWELPPGQETVDMADELGLVCHRVHPLLVLPPKSRLKLPSLS